MKEKYRMKLDDNQSVTIYEDDCLSTCARDGDNPEVDLTKEQTEQVYLKLKEIFEPINSEANRNQYILGYNKAIEDISSVHDGDKEIECTLNSNKKP